MIRMETCTTIKLKYLPDHIPYPFVAHPYLPHLRQMFNTSFLIGKQVINATTKEQQYSCLKNFTI
jgi:hypothetical protein